MYLYISLDDMKPYLVSVLLIGEYILTNCSRKEQLMFALRLKIFFSSASFASATLVAFCFLSILKKAQFSSSYVKVFRFATGHGYIFVCLCQRVRTSWRIFEKNFL